MAEKKCNMCGVESRLLGEYFGAACADVLLPFLRVNAGPARVREVEEKARAKREVTLDRLFATIAKASAPAKVVR